MNYLLDSTDLIDLLRKKRSTLEFVAQALAAGDKLLTSAMNVAEIYGGLRPGEEAETARVLADIECLPVTRSIAKLAGELKTRWARKGRTLGLADMIVAATALEYGLLLMTANRKDFPVDGIVFGP